MNSHDYLKLEIKNLLAGIRPTQSSRTLNPYAGGCEGCPFCGQGSGLYGGVVNDWTKFQQKISSVEEGQHLTPHQRSELYNSLSEDEKRSILHVMNGDILNSFVHVKKLQLIPLQVPPPLPSTRPPPVPLQEERKIISTKLEEPVIEQIQEALQSDEPLVAEIIKEIEQQVPTEIVKELSPTQLETAKEVLAETYFACLKRAPAGHKRETCKHLTKKYIKEKIEHIEKQSSQYESWIDCMIENKGTKGIRKICKPYAKKKKTVYSEAQKGKYKSRQKLVANKAKQLKKKYPNKTYQQRLKMARKLVK